MIPSLALILSTFAVAYGLGSVPFGLILTGLAGLGDIRKIGSGNIGATNVARSGHKMLALATLLLDAGKGIAAVLIVRALYEDTVLIAALFAVLGHVFPVWLKFKGGKGVATTLGVLFAINATIGLCAGAIWLGVFGLSRISSLSALAALWVSPLLAYIFAGAATGILALALAGLISFTHRANIERLMRGTEHAFKGTP